jgi:omega-6 fatty acid desaturase (delta-12 desaturase)
LTSDRAALRRSIRPFRASANLRAAVICAVDVLLFFGAAVAVVAASTVLVKLLAATIAGLAIARLFVDGHDACHQALFSNRTANRVVGKLVFLPSLTPFSLWEAGHNVSHHVYTNLKTHDFVWTPFSREEFQALPVWRQRLERFYRSGFGFWAYYGIEIWWRKMIFPNEREVPLRRPAFFSDSLLVCGFTIVWLASLAAAAYVTDQSVVLLLVCGFVVPMLVWQLLMGAVIYFQHTHPSIAWFDNTEEWETTREGLSGTMLVSFPKRLGWIVNNIMEHPAHHLDVRIPLYRLEAAQEILNAQPTGARSQPFGWKLISESVRCCKLYDYSAHRWTDFDGNYTSDRAFQG